MKREGAGVSDAPAYATGTACQQAVINGYRLKIEMLEAQVKGLQSENARLLKENTAFKARTAEKRA